MHSKQAYNYASLIKRFLAFVLDYLIVYATLILFLALLWPDSSSTFESIVSNIFYFLYNIIFWTKLGATPGKMLFRIKVIDASTGTFPSYFKSTGRYISYLLTLGSLGLGFFWALKSPYSRTWHDITANTVVVCQETSGHPLEELLPNRSHNLQKYITILVGCLCVLFFPFSALRLPSASMATTLPKGTSVIINSYAYGIPMPHILSKAIPVFVSYPKQTIITYSTPERGDIIAFKFPKNLSFFYLKRCIALPGDSLFLKDKVLYLHLREGDAYVRAHYPESQIEEISGKLWIKDPYKLEYPGIHNDDSITNDGTRLLPLFDMPPITVSQGEYFVLGDNRDHSNDSRFWGTVPENLIAGKYLFQY